MIKAIVTLMVLAATWYFAGMNSRAPMMIVMIGGIIFLIVTGIISIVLARRMKVKIPEQKNVMYKNAEIPFSFEVMTNTKLPINKYCLDFTMQYAADKKIKTRKRFFGSAGIMSKGESEKAEYYFTPPYSGKIRITVKRVVVFDYLAIYASSRRVRDCTGEVAIIPYPKKLRIDLPGIGIYSEEPVTETSSDERGEDHSEIRQVREYQPGDLIRHIHHNYTARTQTLWVREYQKENDYIFDMILDTSADENADAEVMDAFFEIVSSVVDTLAGMDVILRVYWYDPDLKGMRLHTVESSDDCTNMMGELILSSGIVSAATFANATGGREMKGFVINNKLEWMFMDEPVFRFTKDSFESELRDNAFDLRG